MSEDDQKKWDQKYRDGAFEARTHPSALLADWLPTISEKLLSARIEPPWRALDIACGAGRNAFYLADNGFSVDAIDISQVAIDRAQHVMQNTSVGSNRDIAWHQVDLEDGLPPTLNHYHLIIMMRYVNMPLLRELPSRLIKSGFIVCEEHLQTERPVVGPKNPNFRVAEGALKQALSSQDVCYQADEFVLDPDGETAGLARIVCQKNYS